MRPSTIYKAYGDYGGFLNSGVPPMIGTLHVA